MTIKGNMSALHSSTMRLTLVALLVVSLLAQLGCDPKQALPMASAGMETSQTLTSFYETLAQETIDTVDMEIAALALLKVHPEVNLGITDDEIDVYKKRANALNSRAKMARKMSEMFTALKDYSSYDSGAQIEAAAKSLSKAAFGLIPLPFVGAPDPSAIIGAVAGDLARFAQFRDIKEKSRVSLELLQKINELFGKEAEAYVAIMRENSVTATAVAKSLIENELVISWQLLDKVPDRFGLKWADAASAPVKDPATKEAFKKIVEQRNARMSDLAKNATAEMQDALTNLEGSIKKFLNKKPLDLENVLTYLNRARFYVAEIQKLKTVSQ